MTHVLAVDQSTSATKALLFESDGSRVEAAGAVSEHEQLYPRPGWVEHDAEEVFRNTLDTVAAVIREGRVVREDLLCLSIANQRETVVVFDRRTGKPLHNAVVWQCRRGDDICEALIREGYNAQVQRATGLRIDSYFSAPKLKWLLDNSKKIRHAVEAGEALIGTIDTYLIYRLTNGQVFATDHTNACRTLLYNIDELRWDPRLCQLFGVPPNSLPEVRESRSHFGETDLGGLLDRTIPICGVMGDSQAALFAERCFDPGSAKVTLGTGSSVLLNTGDKFCISDSGIVSTLAWVYKGNPTYAFEGIINFAGATIAWLKNQLQLIDDAGACEEMAKAVADNGGVYLVPAFVGLSAPQWNHTARAAILGLTPHSDRNHVVRAALEAIAYQVKDVLDLMASDAGVHLRAVRADGGMARNAFLLQFIADMTRQRVLASTKPESSALGAVLSGTLGMGVHGALEDLLALPHESRSFVPSMPASLVEKNYAGWKAAVSRVL